MWQRQETHLRKDGTMKRSLLALVVAGVAVSAASAISAKVAAPAAGKEDPAATKLLAEARAARAEWVNFPGFSADVAVNLNGQVYHGRVVVDAKGKPAFTQLDPAAEKWAKPILASVVSHRLAGPAETETPCAFVNDDADHPLGREIRLLSDDTHSSFRIKDRQIMVVNRAMKDSRFTITMQENRTNAEGRFLPANYVVDYWGPNGDLQRTEAHTQTWTRTGSFDLPLLARVITADRDVTVRCLTLSNHKLLMATSAQ
jgi:uncharacterized protein DUF3386